MRRIGPGTAAAVAVAFALAVAGGAVAAQAKTIQFSGAYKGNATTKVSGTVVDINAKGTGTGTLIGAGTISGVGKGDSSNPPCVPFSGPGSIAGSGGKLSLNVLPTSRGCGSQDDNAVSVVGYAKVMKATGKLKGAKGTLKFTGTYDRGTGAFSVKFKGALTKA